MLAFAKFQCVFKVSTCLKFALVKFFSAFYMTRKEAPTSNATFKALKVAKRRKMFFEEDSNFTRGHSARENSWQTEFDNNFL